jgi:hypothetical protein
MDASPALRGGVLDLRTLHGGCVSRAQHLTTSSSQQAAARALGHAVRPLTSVNIASRARACVTAS